MTTTEETPWTLWLRSFTPAPAGVPRLFCFPHAGGSAGYFLRLSRLLSPQIEVLAVQYPGRQDRRAEPHILSVPEFATEIADVLQDRLSGQYAFLGHSLGATIAFEVARELERRTGGGPRRLFASGRRAPSRYRPEDVHLRDEAGVLAELATLDAGDPGWLREPELVELFLPTIRSDYQAIETYKYEEGPPLGSPITVLTGDTDPRTDAEDARAWRAHSAPGFELRELPGGHFFIADHWPAVAGLIRAELLLTAGASGRDGALVPGQRRVPAET